MSKRLPFILVFLIVLADTISWGMVIPILPTYAQRFRADALTVGLLLATYSLAQFIFAPLLGNWSDRVGRRPVLLASIFGTICAALLTGFASFVELGLAMLFLGRALDGATGGNLSTAQSYVADITPPDERAQGMGMIGAAIGLGYTFGPAISGFIAGAAGPAAPFFAAAGLAAVNLAGVAAFLPESLPPERRRPSGDKAGRLDAFLDAYRNPNVGVLLGVGFLATFAGILYMSMLPLFTGGRLNFVERDNAYLFGFMGLVVTLVQGGVIRPLVKRLGEIPLLVAGLVVLGVSLVLVGHIGSPVSLYVLVAGLSVGTALVNPTLLGLISRRSRADEQGRNIGVNASVSSLARIVGPVWGGFVFHRLGPQYSFYSGTLACLAALAIFVFSISRHEDKIEAGEEAAVP